MKRKISIVSSCYNEEGNLPEFYDRLIAVLGKFPKYDYEIIVADNCSTDGSRKILRELAAKDRNFKVILNSNNFGHIRSPYNALLNASGDAVVYICSDLQEPPETIAELIQKWEEGNEVVTCIKSKSREFFVMHLCRKFYYRLLAYFSDSKNIITDFTGFGLYTGKFIEALKKYHDPYPYFRGLVSEIGFKRTTVKYTFEVRKHGKTKNNFFTLYDMAMTGFVNHSKLPLRLATFLGFCLAGISLMVALVYLVYKLIFWYSFDMGLAPLLIGLFFFSSVQLIFIGIIGEYVGAIFTQVKDKPLVIEEEKINFND